MKTIKELNQDKFESASNSSLRRKVNAQIGTLKEVLGLIDEMDEFVSGLISAEELKARING